MGKTKTGRSTTEIETPLGIALISYFTPVAFYLNEEVMLTTEVGWSVTTTQHISKFRNKYNPKEVRVVPQREIEHWFEISGGIDEG